MCVMVLTSQYPAMLFIYGGSQGIALLLLLTYLEAAISEPTILQPCLLYQYILSQLTTKITVTYSEDLLLLWHLSYPETKTISNFTLIIRWYDYGIKQYINIVDTILALGDCLQHRFCNFEVLYQSTFALLTICYAYSMFNSTKNIWPLHIYVR